MYNLGGGKSNACSNWEASRMVESITGIKQVYTYVEQSRHGDHICYYSDLRKIRSHFPAWRIERPLPKIIEEIATAWVNRKSTNVAWA